MSRRKLTETIELDSELLDTNVWPGVNITSLNEEDLKTFQNRKEAIEMYLRMSGLIQSRIKLGLIERN
ncbi:hypothetical protein KHA80_21475 [Anaerobacillus sp. HL2]|nr:hypothetical protein KHA80_21475 [Anaerobacillus sp. HL2]